MSIFIILNKDLSFVRRGRFCRAEILVTAILAILSRITGTVQMKKLSICGNFRPELA